MKLAGRDVEVVLSEDGQSALRLAGLELPETALAGFFVEDTDEMGMWVRITRADETHSLLIRWEFVLSVDLLRQKRRSIGLST
jgi:hypothetical protein